MGKVTGLVDKIKNSGNEIKMGDLTLLCITIALVIFGTVMVFSASYYYAIAESGDPYAYLKKQLIWVLLGAILMWIFSKIDYHFWGKLYVPILIVCIILLGLIMTPLGITENGATRWLGVPGIPFTIMPGEVAKFGIIIFIAGYYAKRPKIAGTFFAGVVFPLVITGGCFLLIMKQPNMSTGMTLCMIAGAMMLVAGIKWKYVFGLIGAAAAGAIVLIFSDTSGYRFQRMLSFLDPFEDIQGNGWQVVQGLYALGTGGLTGLGLGNSVQKNLYLPEAQNDFILAIIGEELGFIGILILMAAYLVLIWRGCHIAINAPDFLGMMLAAGVTIMIGVQVVLNVAVVTSSMPPTGVVLPFISYGGNALMIFMASIGMVLNISKKSNL